MALTVRYVCLLEINATFTLSKSCLINESSLKIETCDYPIKGLLVIT